MQGLRVLGLAAVLAACGSDGNEVASGVLVRTDPAGVQCPTGGSVINSGVDINGDAILEDFEIQVRTPVCNPALDTAGDALTRLAVEPAGANCADGGTAIETGRDSNGNGVLDDAEVTHTDYICGEVLLTRLEPATTCAGGGVAIELGRDRDHDGTLSDAEVEHTEVSCGDVIDANVTVRSATDVAALANIVLVHGDLALLNGGSIQLPKLQIVTGRLDVEDPGITELVAPALTSVDGEVALVRTRLTAPSVPALAHVGGRLLVDSNGSLTALALPALTAIGGDVTVSNNSQLQTLTLPTAQIDGDVSFTNNTKLAQLSWSLRAAPRSMTVLGNGLTSFSLSGDGPRPFDVSISSEPQLTDVELSSSHFGRLYLVGDALARVTVRATSEVVSLTAISPALDRVTVAGATGQPFQVSSLLLNGPVSTLDAGTARISAGPVSLQGTKLVDLHAFTSVSSLHADGNTALTTIQLALRGFSITNNPALTSIAPIATSLHGLLTITGNPALTEVLLHDVTSIDGELDVKSNPQLTSLRMPVLADVSSILRISGNPKLAELDVSDLLHIQDHLDLFATALTTLSLPSLVTGGDFYIGGNPVLGHIAAPAFRHAHILEISTNAQLPACEVAALFTGMTGDLRQDGNDTTATCTP